MEKFSKNSSLNKEEFKPGSKSTTDLVGSTVDSVTSTETIASTSDTSKTSSRDEVASRIDAFDAKASKVMKPNAKDRSKFKRGKNKSIAEGLTKHVPNEGIIKSATSTPQNATSSVVTQTVINTTSNFNLASSKESLVTSGWIDVNDGLSLFSQLNDLFHKLGINSANLLTYRGDLLRSFSDWSSLLTIRPNKSSKVYALDAPDSDKSLSSETIFNNFYKQRRPFRYAFNGVPQIKARALPAINYNLKLLNVSTNGHSPVLEQNYAKYCAYGKLVQDLGNTLGYQTRKVSLDTSQNSNIGFFSSEPHKLRFMKLPSTNHNGVGEWYGTNTSNNKLLTGALSFFADDAPTIEGPINASLELINKVKFFNQLFRNIQDEAVAYARKQDSGDNAWFSPIYLIDDEKTLAATMNSLADLKTALYIINDAIKGAAASQLIKATKCGTPDSTYVGIVSKSTYYKNEYSSQFNELWVHFKNIPMHRDVIEKWNQYKSWSKFNDKDLYDNDNMLMIPVFLLTRAGGAYYNNSFELKPFANQNNLPALVPTKAQLFNALALSVQTLDKSQFFIPQGDAYSMFFQSVIAHMSLSSLIRVGRSNTKYAFNSKKFDTNTLNLNSVQLSERFVDAQTEAQSESEGEIWVPDRNVVFQRNVDQTSAEPLTINGTKLNDDTLLNAIPKDLGGSANQYGDFTISYHTFTGFMAGFMDMIVTGVVQGHLASWISYLQAVNPYFARIMELAPKDHSLMFGDIIDPISTNNLPEPFSSNLRHDINQNIDFYYSSTPFTTSQNFSYVPTRLNFMNNTEFQKFRNYPYKAIGNRWVIINEDGKADRDITADNTLITLNGTRNVKNVHNRNVKGSSIYCVSWSVTRINDFMQYNSPNNESSSIFPIYIGSHAGEMFLSSFNLYLNPSNHVAVSQLQARSLLVNSSDEVNMSVNPGVFDYAVTFNLLDSFNKFINETGTLVSNVTYIPNIISSANYDLMHQIRIISQYNNNGLANVTSTVVDEIYKRWVNNTEYVSTKTFSTL